MSVQCEAGRPMCPQTEKLLQLTITQQASVIFRDCITVCPCLLSNSCLDTGTMANPSLTPNMKLSPSPQKHSPSLAATLTQSGVNLASASRKHRTHPSEDTLWFYVLFLQPTESGCAPYHAFKTQQNRSERWAVLLRFLKKNGDKSHKKQSFTHSRCWKIKSKPKLIFLFSASSALKQVHQIALVQVPRTVLTSRCLSGL